MKFASPAVSERDNSPALTHDNSMDIASLRTIMMAVPDLEDLNADKIEALWDACNRFFDWEKRVMLNGQPTGQDQADHKAVLNWLTTIVKLTAKAHHANEDLEMMRFRLEGSRAMFYSSMTEE